MMIIRIAIPMIFFCLSPSVYSALDLTSWMKVDQYNRWSFSNPTPDSIRMDETAASQTVASSWPLKQSSCC